MSKQVIYKGSILAKGSRRLLDCGKSGRRVDVYTRHFQ